MHEILEMYVRSMPQWFIWLIWGAGIVLIIHQSERTYGAGGSPAIIPLGALFVAFISVGFMFTLYSRQMALIAALTTIAFAVITWLFRKQLRKKGVLPRYP